MAPPPLWFARTHHDVLVQDHGLNPEIMLLVPCACGVAPRRADYMVDVTPLPLDVREALGIAEVDYLCDGCTTRLFRDQHITQEEFNRLLGAPGHNLALVREYDEEYRRGIQNRPPHHRPGHTPIRAGRSMNNAGALPLQQRTLRHTDTVRDRPLHFRKTPAAVAHPLTPSMP